MTNRIELTKSGTRTLVRDYKAGVTLAEIAVAQQISVPTVRRLLADAGVTIRSRGRQAQV